MNAPSILTSRKEVESFSPNISALASQNLDQIARSGGDVPKF